MCIEPCCFQPLLCYFITEYLNKSYDVTWLGKQVLIWKWEISVKVTVLPVPQDLFMV